MGDFDGMTIKFRNPATGHTYPVWAGEFHSYVGEGRVASFCESIVPDSDGGLPYAVTVANSRTGMSFTFPFSDAHTI
jgi:hypothetical protein